MVFATLKEQKNRVATVYFDLYNKWETKCNNGEQLSFDLLRYEFIFKLCCATRLRIFFVLIQVPLNAPQRVTHTCPLQEKHARENFCFCLMKKRGVALFYFNLRQNNMPPLRKFFMRSFRSLDASMIDMARQVGFSQCAKTLHRGHKNWDENFYLKMGHVLAVGQQT